MTVGEIIKEYRKKHNLKVVELAEKLNFTQVYITNIENDKRKMPNSVLEQLEKIMTKEEFKVLKKAVDLSRSPETVKSELLNLKEMKTIDQKKIPYYRDIQASAGHGYFNQDSIYEYLEVPAEFAKNNNIAITVAGDSMEPEIKDGDVIIIDTNYSECLENKIFVVNYKDAVFLKRIFIDDEDNMYLCSINPYYPKILIEDKEELKIIGKLISVIRKY